MNSEEKRLEEVREGVAWRRWGPYLSERAWGTVREDYSPGGTAWTYFPHDHARSRAYRWNEDGLLGWCDDNGWLCFSVALWNGHDPILKERAFGLTGEEGNHGEDVKECFYYLDGLPSHAYNRALYKYPQRAFPYADLVQTNAARGKNEGEYELLDTGIFQNNRYFDVFVEYAKSAPDELAIRLSIHNRGPERAELHVLPHLVFRNTWSWGRDIRRPTLKATGAGEIEAHHHQLGTLRLICDTSRGAPDLLFTENETNAARIFGGQNESPFVKDAFHRWMVEGDKSAVNPAQTGTKAAAHYHLNIEAGGKEEIWLRLGKETPSEAFGAAFEELFALRKREADEFYAEIAPPKADEDLALVQRQALAGLLWSKQFYNYNVYTWLHGDAVKPPPERLKGRNHDWKHVHNHEVIAMPDKWEYPWYAAWDLSFHCVAMALVDADFAKDQLILLLREWYMHPNGQLPAYEWAFGDVNPPVHAWAALRVYQMERKRRGTGDSDFLERVFHKLLLNFTWWINRKDKLGRNLFQGGFLGLDNIGPFDRSQQLPGGVHLDQADGTAWMAMYCLNMLAIALELARNDATYEDVATKFLEHFFFITHAMNNHVALDSDDAIDLWDDADGFYYDVLHFPDGGHEFVKVRSLVGLIPLLAVQTLESADLEQLPTFHARLQWFLEHRLDLVSDAASITRTGRGERRLLAVVNEERLRLLLARMLDESEFLSPFGLRSLSRFHRDTPYKVNLSGHEYGINYQPAESTTSLFGGNSNWRGPIWMPINFLLIEALQKFDYFYGDQFQAEFPVGSGQYGTLWDVSVRLSQRLIALFLRDGDGKRPVLGSNETLQADPNFRDCVPFHEYFHGDTGTGLGAAHQTGWTALVAKLIQQSGEGMRGDG